MGRSGGRILLFYFITSLLAAVVGLGLFWLFFRSSVPQLVLGDAAGAVEATEVDIITLLKNIIPSDLVSPILHMDMLQVLFVSILFGAALGILQDQLGIDSILTMFRVTHNVTGDIAATAAVAAAERQMDMEVYRA